MIWYLPFVQSDGQLSFCLIGPLSERTSIVVAIKPAFGAWLTVFGDAKMTTTMLDRITRLGKPSGNHFALDRHPSMLGPVHVCGFTGYAFKLAQAIGAALVDMALDNMTHLPVVVSQARRFTNEAIGLSQPSSSSGDARVIRLTRHAKELCVEWPERRRPGTADTAYTC